MPSSWRRAFIGEALATRQGEYGPIALGRQEDAGDALAHRRAERARREADERAAYEKAADLESERPLPDLDATDAEMTREEQEGQQQQEAQYRILHARPTAGLDNWPHKLMELQ